MTRCKQKKGVLWFFGAVSFSQPPNDMSLSTLEACAHSIEQMAEDNMQPLREFMSAQRKSGNG